MTYEMIRIEKDDVTVKEIIDKCSECGKSILASSYCVVVEFRAAGMSTRVGQRYCKPCAEQFASRIRAGLPDPIWPVKL